MLIALPARAQDAEPGATGEEQAEQVLTEIVEAHDQVLDEPKPIVKVHTLNDSSVDFVVRPWACTDDYWDVYQRDVHMIGQGTEQEPSNQS